MSGREVDHGGPEAGRLTSPTGVVLAYEVEGRGPPLILVHGSFSNHHSNWALITPKLVQQFTVFSLARRGRGGTDATRNHSLLDEAHDLGALIEAINDKVFLIGHSYGAQVALAATGLYRANIRKLVLYEPPKPESVPPKILRELERISRKGDWALLAETFFRKVLMVPPRELEELRQSVSWSTIVGDACASLHDLIALTSHDSSADHFGSLDIPVLLQVGSESPRDMFATDLLARVLPDVRIEELKGQGHEGMNTAPDYYARSLLDFLRL